MEMKIQEELGMSCRHRLAPFQNKSVKPNLDRLSKSIVSHLIVDLEEENVAELLEFFGLVYFVHREGHDVGRTALDRRVDCGALVVSGDRAILTVDAAQVSVPFSKSTPFWCGVHQPYTVERAGHENWRQSRRPPCPLIHRTGLAPIIVS